MIDLLRHPPIAGYEPIVTEAFKKKYGKDMETLDVYSDPARATSTCRSISRCSSWTCARKSARTSRSPSAAPGRRLLPARQGVDRRRTDRHHHRRQLVQRQRPAAHHRPDRRCRRHQRQSLGRRRGVRSRSHAKLARSQRRHPPPSIKRWPSHSRRGASSSGLTTTSPHLEPRRPPRHPRRRLGVCREGSRP